MRFWSYNLLMWEYRYYRYLALVFISMVAIYGILSLFTEASDFFIFVIITGIVLASVLDYGIEHGYYIGDDTEESEKDRKERLKDLDFSKCMSCDERLSSEDEYCKNCGYNVGKHKITT